MFILMGKSCASKSKNKRILEFLLIAEKIGNSLLLTSRFYRNCDNGEESKNREFYKEQRNSLLQLQTNETYSVYKDSKTENFKVSSHICGNQQKSEKREKQNFSLGVQKISVFTLFCSKNLCNQVTRLHTFCHRDYNSTTAPQVGSLHCTME